MTDEESGEVGWLRASKGTYRGDKRLERVTRHGIINIIKAAMLVYSHTVGT